MTEIRSLWEKLCKSPKTANILTILLLVFGFGVTFSLKFNNYWFGIFFAITSIIITVIKVIVDLKKDKLKISDEQKIIELSNKLEKATNQINILESSLEEAKGDLYTGLAYELNQIKEEFKLDGNDRLSLYFYDDQKKALRLIHRIADNPDFEQCNDNILPPKFGFSHRAMNSKSGIVHFNHIKKTDKLMMKECRRQDCTIDEQFWLKMTMKSLSFACYAIFDNRKRCGVLTLESLTPNKWDVDNLNLYMSQAKERLGYFTVRNSQEKKHSEPKNFGL